MFWNSFLIQDFIFFCILDISFICPLISNDSSVVKSPIIIIIEVISLRTASVISFLKRAFLSSSLIQEDLNKSSTSRLSCWFNLNSTNICSLNSVSSFDWSSWHFLHPYLSLNIIVTKRQFNMLFQPNQLHYTIKLIQIFILENNLIIYNGTL